MTTPTQRCPNCDSAQVERFYAVNDIPTQSCVLCDTESEARSYPRGDLELGWCPQCCFIHNTLFDPATQEHSTRYEVTQGFSGAFNRFLVELTTDLIERYDVRRKRVVEIGCGAGEFLAALAVHGENECIGIDPATDPDRLAAPDGAEITLLSEYWSAERHAALDADVICCRHTLEHILHTRDFIRSVRAGLGDRPESLAVFEVPDIARILNECAFWDIYYEHCGYFGMDALEHVFQSNGFEIVEHRRVFGDQYLWLIARPAQITAHECHAPNAEEIHRFTNDVTTTRAAWRRWFERHPQRTALWGSGSKAVGFLTTLGITTEVDCIVDINPHRSGKFSPGTGHPIIAPSQLPPYEPQTVIVMNAAYQVEIKSDLATLGVTASVLTTDQPPTI